MLCSPTYHPSISPRVASVTTSKAKSCRVERSTTWRMSRCVSSSKGWTTTPGEVIFVVVGISLVGWYLLMVVQKSCETNQLRLVGFSHYLRGFIIHPRWLAGFLTSTVGKGRIVHSRFYFRWRSVSVDSLCGNLSTYSVGLDGRITLSRVHWAKLWQWDQWSLNKSSIQTNIRNRLARMLIDPSEDPQKYPNHLCATSARINRRTAQWWSSISNKTRQSNENPYATSWCRCPKSCVYGWQTSNVLSWYGDNGSSDSTSYDNYMYIKINEYKRQTLCCIKI